MGCLWVVPQFVVAKSAPTVNSWIQTTLDRDIKTAATRYCKQRGIKLQYFIEQAIIEQLEDEIDLAAYHQRKNEETVSLTEVLKNRKLKKSLLGVKKSIAKASTERHCW